MPLKAANQYYFPDASAKHWYVCGGGRHNPALMQAITRRLIDGKARSKTLGWYGDAIEAQAFAYLAVRSLKHLLLPYPPPRALTGRHHGGAFYAAG